MMKRFTFRQLFNSTRVCMRHKIHFAGNLWDLDNRARYFTAKDLMQPSYDMIPGKGVYQVIDEMGLLSEREWQRWEEVLDPERDNHKWHRSVYGIVQFLLYHEDQDECFDAFHKAFPDKKSNQRKGT